MGNEKIYLNAVFLVNCFKSEAEKTLVLDHKDFPKPVLDNIRHNFKEQFKIRYNDKGNLEVTKNGS